MIGWPRRQKNHHYVINENTGARLCQDGKWRNHANFGSTPSCVKKWNDKGWAIRKMNQLNQKSTCPIAYVLTLPENQYMDASGKVFTEEEKTSNNT